MFKWPFWYDRLFFPGYWRRFNRDCERTKIGVFSINLLSAPLSAITYAMGAANEVFATIERHSPIDSSNVSGLKPVQLNGEIVFHDIDFGRSCAF
jgi:hypothetical protein